MTGINKLPLSAARLHCKHTLQPAARHCALRDPGGCAAARQASADCLNSVTWFGNEKGMFLAFIFGNTAGQQNPQSSSVSLVSFGGTLLGYPPPTPPPHHPTAAPPLPPHQGT